LKNKNRFVCWLWGLVFRKFTLSSHTNTHGRVVMAKGWRTATVCWGYAKMSITPSFWWLK